MNITSYGHATFMVETGEFRLLIDPFLTDNPAAPITAAEVKCDYLLLSHGHEDHTCDTVEIARANNATIIANFELAEYYAAQGLKTHGMSPGGGFSFPFGRAALTPAIHTSSFNAGANPIYMGVACGILIEARGKRLYHAGDTALFSDMKLIGRHGLDLALLPIGDNFTMGPADALDALDALDLLAPRLAVPMHYDTWPLIAQDAAAFAQDAAARHHPVKVLPPGASLSI